MLENYCLQTFIQKNYKEKKKSKVADSLGSLSGIQLNLVYHSFV